jgi:hypothetical protein
LNYYNYFTEIEETFVRRRGKNLFLSPLDWALIEAWQDRGIPLHIVIRSIESVFDVFDQQPVGTRSIKSLLYCREEIEVQYKEWSTSQTGSSADETSNGSFSTNEIADHIAKTITALRSNTSASLKEDIERAVARLEELSLDLTDDFETIDKTLGDIERLLDRALVSNWEPSHMKVLQKEIAGHLRGYKAEMTPEAYKSTFDLMLLKRLREEAGIPRLGLFYL